MDEKDNSERALYDEVLDYVVYAPIGMAMRVAGALPDLVREGRACLEGTLQAANVFGRLAVGQLKHQFDRNSNAPPPSRATTAAREGGTLALSGYDDLAASEIVSRLADCSAAERAAIRDYETGHRNRRTILNRIAQLSEG